jgi:hypothetical protein
VGTTKFGEWPARQLLLELGPTLEVLPLVMNEACEGDETRQRVPDPGVPPVVPPKSKHIDLWTHNRGLYKMRDKNERLFYRHKGLWRIFSRFENLGVFFLACLCSALIIETLRIV